MRADCFFEVVVFVIALFCKHVKVRHCFVCVTDVWDEDVRRPVDWALKTNDLSIYVCDHLPGVSEGEAAVAMLTEPLSGRRDLVEGLDADAIYDYLCQHGVLDGDTVGALRATSGPTQRNAALLRHVEREGHTAVALFINALRQSGQLHLASALDTRRIQPMAQGGQSVSSPSPPPSSPLPLF